MAEETEKRTGNGLLIETRSVHIPKNRNTPINKDWDDLCDAIVNQLKLDTMLDAKGGKVHLRINAETDDANAMQKGENYLKAYMLGFRLKDCTAFLRVNDLYTDTFNVRDVKAILKGDNLSRAIGRVAGRGGEVRRQIEDSTRTRIVLTDCKVHIMGSFANIKFARGAIADLIIGSPPGKVMKKLQMVSDRIRAL